MNTGQNNLGPDDLGFPDCSNEEHQDLTDGQIQALRRPRMAANLPEIREEQILDSNTAAQAGMNSAMWGDSWDGMMCGDDFAPGPQDQWVETVNQNVAPLQLHR